MKRQFPPAMTIAVLILAATASMSTAAPALSGPGEVEIELSEFKLESSLTTFSKGIPYRFVVKNVGHIAQEWMARSRGEMDPWKVLIKIDANELYPGATVLREVTFARSGNWEFACNTPGHYEAGMVLPIIVK